MSLVHPTVGADDRVRCSRLVVNEMQRAGAVVLRPLLYGELRFVVVVIVRYSVDGLARPRSVAVVGVGNACPGFSVRRKLSSVLPGKRRAAIRILYRHLLPNHETRIFAEEDSWESFVSRA